MGAVMRPLRDRIISSAASSPSEEFSLLIAKGEAWATHPRVVAEAQKRGIAASDIVAHVDVTIADSYGYPVSAGEVDTRGRYTKVSSRNIIDVKACGDDTWASAASCFLAILRQCPPIPEFRDDGELLAALCRLSQGGFAESRCLALEALGILAPSGHEGAIEAAACAVAASDVSVRHQAMEVLVSLLQPEQEESLQARLQGKHDPYTELALKELIRQGKVEH